MSTNPNNSVGTNGAYGGRTSVNAFNDDLAAYTRGILSGWACEPDSGLTVVLGGDGNTRDVAIAEDNAGNKTTINNISGSPISVTLGAAPVTNSRVDSIVAYVDNPPTGTNTVTDNYGACGLIVVAGTAASTPVAPNESAIRTAITADGASGTTAYYVVLANITIASGTTDLTSDNITAGASAAFSSDKIVKYNNMDFTTFPANSVVTRIYVNTVRSAEKGTFTATTLKGTTLTFGWSAYGGINGIVDGAGNIKHVRVIYSADFQSTTGDYGLWGLVPNTANYTYGYAFKNSTSGSSLYAPENTGAGDAIGDYTIGYCGMGNLGSGEKTGTSGVVDCIKLAGENNVWHLMGTMHSFGSGSALQFSSEVRAVANAVPSIYQRGITSLLNSYYYIFEIYE